MTFYNQNRWHDEAIVLKGCFFFLNIVYYVQVQFVFYTFSQFLIFVQGNYTFHALRAERRIVMTFSQNLEHIRKAQKVSQKELGSALGITQQMVSSYEKGFSAPTMDILLQLAKYFNVSLDTLVGFEPEDPEENSVDDRFLSYFHTLNHADKERCLTIVQTILHDREMNDEGKKTVHGSTGR